MQDLTPGLRGYEPLRGAMTRGHHVVLIILCLTLTALTSACGSSSQSLPSGNEFVWGASMIAFARGGDHPGIYALNLDTAQERRLTEGRDRSPVWSLSGDRVAFIRGDTTRDAALMIMDFAADGEVRRIEQVATNVAVVTWGPGANQVTVAAPGGVEILDLKSRSRELISSDATVDTLSWDRSPKTLYLSSPMGIHALLFDEGRSPEETRWGGLADSDLVVGPGGALAWSRGIGFPDSLIRSLFIRRGDQSRKISDGASTDLHPTWSPDETGVVFTRYEIAPGGDWKGPPEIFMLHLLSGAARRLTDNDVPDFDPAWRPARRSLR